MSDATATDGGDRPRAPVAVVTGAAGWLGQNLVRALVGQRSRVRCLVSSGEQGAALELLDAAVETVVGDVRDPTTVDRLFEGVADAVVFHAAAVIHPRSRVRELFDVNVGGTQLVVDRARRASTIRFVHVSSNSPFGANPSPTDRFTEESAYNPYLAYGRSKLEAEQLVLRSHGRGDVHAVVVRPPWFYGPFQPERQTTWLRTVRHGRFPLVGDGTNQRSMVATDNLVHGLLRAEVAPLAPGNAYWLADGEPYEMREVLATVRAAFVAEGFTVSGGQPRLPRTAGVVAEHLDRLLQARGRYVQALHVLGELKDTIACDITRARAELGYRPTTTLLDGMRASIRWCVERGEQFA
ncbi:MAG TPA: NAD(P)-dependent oxidoreductase [Acidimicrobiia bacterium]|nr:NAD(P)-dependent oxidoreductase [Acidimicrobiia bacterium]